MLYKSDGAKKLGQADEVAKALKEKREAADKARSQAVFEGGEPESDDGSNYDDDDEDFEDAEDSLTVSKDKTPKPLKKGSPQQQFKVHKVSSDDEKEN